MQFRDLKAQYQALKSEIDQAVSQVITDSNFYQWKTGDRVGEEPGRIRGSKTLYCLCKMEPML